VSPAQTAAPLGNTGSPIRVLTPHCGLRAGSQLGGEVFERELLLRLPAHGVRPHIGLPASRSLEQVPEGWEVELLRPGRGLRWYFAPLAFLPFARRSMRRGGVDLLRAHAPRFVGPSLLAARRLQRGCGAPLVVHHHHTEPGHKGVIDVWVLRRADLVVVPSAAVAEDLAQRGVPRGRIAVIPNGVELAAADSRGERWQQAPGARLLFMGRFVERKRPLVAIDAAAALVHEFPELELVMVGRGPLVEAARARVDELGLQRHVRFLPWVDDSVKAWLLESADVFLMPTLLEGFGLVALESQRAGTPVVGGPAPALAEVVRDGETGLLVDASVEAFTEAVRALLRDPEQRCALGAAARQHALMFTWEATAAATARAYRELLDLRCT
jgi:glycosyltransferase involved in cell wall biosynthesis